MPKMTHPDAARPLAVQAEDVDHYTTLGWSLVDAPKVEKKAAPQKAAKTAKTAVTRKSTKKK